MNASSRSIFLLTSRTTSTTSSGRRLVAGTRTSRKLPGHMRTLNVGRQYSVSISSGSGSFHLDSNRSFSSCRSLSSSAAAPQRMEHDYETQCSPKVEKVFEKILNLDMFEVHLVTGLIAEKVGLNVNAAALAAGGVGGGSGGGGGAAAGGAEEEAAAEEKTAFDLKLVSFDAKAKIKVIKEVRSIAGLGLKEAKELVEGAPKTILKEMKKEELEEIAAKMKELGAEVEIV